MLARHADRKPPRPAAGGASGRSARRAFPPTFQIQPALICAVAAASILDDAAAPRVDCFVIIGDRTAICAERYRMREFGGHSSPQFEMNRRT
jgi:hypothetical protein